MGQPDGIGLFGNNTYTGSSTFNGGRSIITGTNATTLFQIVGDRGPFAPAGSTVTLQGANGSLLSATTIQAFAGGQFIIDNTIATDLPPGGDYSAHLRRHKTITASAMMRRSSSATVPSFTGDVRDRSERDLRQLERHRWPSIVTLSTEWRGRDGDIDRERKPHARRRVPRSRSAPLRSEQRPSSLSTARCRRQTRPASCRTWPARLTS